VRNPEKFALMSTQLASNYKIKIHECKLLIKKVKLSPSVFLAHAKAFEVGNGKYPIKRVEIRSITVPAGNMDHKQENLITGQLPTRLVFGLVTNAAYNGQYDLNPFDFKHFNLTHIGLYLDGLQQTIKPLEPDFAVDRYIDAYMSLFSATNRLNKDLGLDIERHEYPNGYALYAFDLSQDNCDDSGDHFNLTREGSVRLELNFAEALPSVVNVIVYAEFENILFIDKKRSVLFDYKA
jgi:hypothetical protein